MGTVNVLEAVRRMRGPCNVINVTTDKVYENRGWVWGYREIDALGGHDPYSSSKACSELVGHSYRESYFPISRWNEHRVAVASARAGNVIGAAIGQRGN
jgi:CDP-glucose 4,6-dehydratase